MTNSLVPTATTLPQLAPFQAPSTLEASSIDIGRWVVAARRRRFLVGGVFVALFALVFTVLMTREKQYSATAVIQISMHEKNAADLIPDQREGDSALTDASRVETEVEVLKSRGLAEDVMKHLRGARAAQAKKHPPPQGLAKALAALVPKSPADPVGEFLAQEKVVHVGQSYIIDVSYVADTPQAAARIANTFVRRYQAWKVRSAISTTDDANAWLNSTLAQLRAEVGAADQAVAQYRASHNLVQAGPSTISEQTISEIGQQLVTAKAAEAEAVARYSTAKAQMKVGGAKADVGEALASPVVSQLRERRASVTQSLADLKSRFGERYPDVVNANNQLADIDSEIRAETRHVLSALKAQADVATKRKDSLQASLDQANKALARQESASVGLSDLLRNQEAARSAYSGYLGRYKQTSAEQNLPQNQVKVVTLAAPSPKPVSPSPAKATALAMAVALVGAAGALLVAEGRQEGFDDTDDIERHFGVRGLPPIPTLSSTSSKRKSWVSPTAYVVQQPLSSFSESFRTLRSVVVASRRDRPVKVVAVTSALPGEGKTTTSVCLGRVAAMGDIEAVIVDCDLRRGALDQVISKRARLGLMDVLSGRASLEEALILDEASGAYFLPVGSSIDAQKSVFDSPHMDRMLAELRQRFGLVVLDAPPVLALADARLIAQKADTTILLSRWRRTPRRAVEGAVRALADAGAVIAGLSLSQVDLEKVRAGGYSNHAYPYLRDYSGYFAE